MEIKVKDIIEYMEVLAPTKLAEEWDNCGLLIGDRESITKKILLSLDFTDETLDEAIEIGAELIINHHPAFFTGQKSITTDSAIGRRAIKAIQNGISVYAAHTNLDFARGGTNDTLFYLLGLANLEMFIPCKNDNNYSLGNVGEIVEDMNLKEFSKFVGDVLKCDLIRYVGDGDKKIKRVAICTGSGSDIESFKMAIRKNCDVYLTSDIKYHQALDAKDIGLALIDATHYATETIVINNVKRYLDGMFLKDGLTLEVIESKINGQPFKI